MSDILKTLLPNGPVELDAESIDQAFMDCVNANPLISKWYKKIIFICSTGIKLSWSDPAHYPAILEKMGIRYKNVITKYFGNNKDGETVPCVTFYSGDLSDDPDLESCVKLQLLFTSKELFVFIQVFNEVGDPITLVESAPWEKEPKILTNFIANLPIKIKYLGLVQTIEDDEDNVMRYKITA